MVRKGGGALDESWWQSDRGRMENAAPGAGIYHIFKELSSQAVSEHLQM